MINIRRWLRYEVKFGKKKATYNTAYFVTRLI